MPEMNVIFGISTLKCITFSTIDADFAMHKPGIQQQQVCNLIANLSADYGLLGYIHTNFK